MADLALSAAQTLFAALQNKQLQELCDLRNYKSRLEDLKGTVSTVREVLIGAENWEGELTPEQEDYIEKLKYAVYDADDLFDEVLALAELDKHKKVETDSFVDDLFNKVSDFFTSRNPFIVAYNVSEQIKLVGKELEDIAKNHNNFGLKFDSQPIRKMMTETCSYVNKFEVIGREVETKAVVDRLLQSKEEVGFLSIVGVGGLGKTTLAQLVFNDERIVKEFSDSRFWVCISDHDKELFDVRVILSKILEAGKKPCDSTSLELVQSKFHEAFGGKRCLVVLDDIWNEDPCKWHYLKGFLKRLGSESRILATTRSRNASRIIGNGDTRTYELSGLSPENSWRLFALMAFPDKQEHEISTEFVETGHKIVEKCYRVPLALKVVGTLLRGHEEKKWVAYEKKQVTDNRIMSILKFSYLNLESPLKSCFKYCALFPKDFKFNKEMLIRIWEALGYIVPFEKGQSIQDAGEEYFSILLNRCFFQDVFKYKGEVSCKMHDLMHDLAEEVAKNEICRSNYMSGEVGEKVRHILFEESVAERFSIPNKSRSCIIYCSFKAVAQVDNWKRLRVLKVNDADVEALPDTIGNLLHLRCLDLTWCWDLVALPNSITQLQNLQTLCLKRCHSLTHMPPRMDKLTCLTTLTHFIVNEGNDSSENPHVGQLKELQFLTGLRGRITIRVVRFIINSRNKEEGGYLKSLEHIKAICFKFMDSDEQNSDHEALMEKLEPNFDLELMRIKSYKGTKLPNWEKVVDDVPTFLPGLVDVELIDCLEMQKLPLLRRLRHLKTLSLRGSGNLEYMEDLPPATASSKDTTFFPSLVSLELEDLSKVKGWCSNHQWQPFPRLSKLKIHKCPSFASFLRCPSLEVLFLRKCSEDLRISLGHDDDDAKLKEVCIDKFDYLGSMQMESVTSIEIRHAEEMESVSEGAEVLKRCRSLQNLRFFDCPKLRSISGGLEHLSSLVSLRVYWVPKLRFDEDDEPWRSLGHSLRSLTLMGLPEPVSLPKGLQHLTNLQDLAIKDWVDLESIPEWISSFSSLTSFCLETCRKIKSLPEAISQLTSLQRLEIRGCSKELKERCQQDPQGDDWPKIQHIPHFSI